MGMGARASVEPRAWPGCWRRERRGRGENGVLATQKRLTRLTERFVLRVDMLVETLWKVWIDVLYVLGLDVAHLPVLQPSLGVPQPGPRPPCSWWELSFWPYWSLSLTLGFTFRVLHLVLGRFFWLVRVILFSVSCVYILHRYEGELPRRLVVAVYCMTGPVGVYWRSSPGSPSVEEELEHLENQVRLLSMRLNSVLQSLDHSKDK